MFKSILILCLISLSMIGCQPNSSSKKSHSAKDSTLPFPVVIPTITKDYYKLSLGIDSSSAMTEAAYLVFYIGPFKDTMRIGTATGSPSPPIPFFHKNGKVTYKEFEQAPNPYYDYSGYHYSSEDTFKLSLQIDTSKANSIYYPVLLSNIGPDTIHFSRGFYIDICMEAKDSKGAWHPIQVPHWYGCGTGLPVINLPPKTCLLTLAPIFKGNYKTQLRLRLGKNYSKPWFGRIHYSQFKKNNYY